MKLTSKGVFLLISIDILLAISWNTDITMVYIFFVVAFVMFILSFVHLKLNVPNIDVRRTVQHTAFEDEMLNVKLDIHNKKPLPISFFEILDIFPGASPDEQEKSLFVLYMKAREEVIVNYAINCYKRGFWRLGPIRIVSQDALGFFRMRKSIPEYSEVLVYPSLFRIFMFPPLASSAVSWMGVETVKISADSHEFFGIREYQRGDAMSRIHWASTARHNQLIVKQFERSAVQEVTIVLDLKKGHDIGYGKETTLEYAVKIAGSIARFLLNNSVLVQIVGYAEESMILPFGKGDSHAYKILEYLAKVQANGAFSLTDTLEEVSFIAPYNSTLVVIMLDNDIEALASLLQFKVKGIRLIVVLVCVATFGQIKEGDYLTKEDEKRFEETLANLEAYVYRIAKGDDLEKKFALL